MHQPIYTTMAQTCCPYSRAVHEPFPFSSCHLANKYKSYLRKLVSRVFTLSIVPRTSRKIGAKKCQTSLLRCQVN